MTSDDLRTVLEPGQSIDFADGYVARSWREDRPYYAERTGDTLSPEFASFGEARSWLVEAGCEACGMPYPGSHFLGCDAVSS